VVTGASHGIGRACAERILALGLASSVVGVSRSAPPAPMRHLACDLASADAVRDAAAHLERLQGVTLLVNCAGVSKPALLLRHGESDVDAVLDVNLRAHILLTRAVVKAMLRDGTGKAIVSVGSVLGSRARAGSTVYAASKAGLAAFTRSLAHELGPRGIRANVVEPGFIATAMTRNVQPPACALRRMGTADEVASAVAFLLSDQAAYVTAQVLVCDGGLV